MQALPTTGEIMGIIEDEIKAWHRLNAERPADAEILTDRIRSIRSLNAYREDVRDIVRELVKINTEMWHEQDKVRSEDDAVLLRAIRNISPLNQHRNDLIEEVDESVLSSLDKRQDSGRTVTAYQIIDAIECAIQEWHDESGKRDSNYIIVTEAVSRRKPMGVHRDSLLEVVSELAKTNSEIWHEEDKVRTDADAVMVKAVRNMNPLNCHRNDLVEEIDEIIIDQYKNGKGDD